jgi:glycosyltransferase involved in cell wall biosynthesis
MISFIMPAFKGRFLREAISSILKQTISDWELIIVDDCSPENLKVIVDSYPDPRIRYIRNDNNIGGRDLVKQWNHSISFALGEWLVLAADDDLYRPTFCEECIRLTKKYPQVNIIHSSVEQIDENGKHLWNDTILPEYTSRYEYLNTWLRGLSFTCIGNFMFRRQTLLDHGGFIDFPCAFGSDIATPIRESLNGVANTQAMLFCFRQSPTHLSADGSRFKEKIEAITLLSEWIERIGWPLPDNPEDMGFYAIVNPDYLHKKCVYDYFNLVIKFLPFRSIPSYLQRCRRATAKDKVMMALRWVKHRLFQ